MATLFSNMASSDGEILPLQLEALFLYENTFLFSYSNRLLL